MKTLPLTKAKDDLSAVIRDAETEEILITRHGRPAAIIIGFADDDDWLEYRLLHDCGFPFHRRESEGKHPKRHLHPPRRRS